MKKSTVVLTGITKKIFKRRGYVRSCYLCKRKVSEKSVLLDDDWQPIFKKMLVGQFSFEDSEEMDVWLHLCCECKAFIDWIIDIAVSSSTEKILHRMN
jgi:hypothetical protein